MIVIPISLTVGMSMTKVDLSSATDISSMIQLSVRCSVPWLYLAFAASSVHALYRSELSRWLMRNRRILGLCFAAGMAWQPESVPGRVSGSASRKAASDDDLQERRVP